MSPLPCDGKLVAAAAGSSECVPCAEGMVATSFNTVCEPCGQREGELCDENGEKRWCDKGSYCPTGSDEFLCQDGSHCPTGKRVYYFVTKHIERKHDLV